VGLSRLPEAKLTVTGEDSTNHMEVRLDVVRADPMTGDDIVQLLA
jgi:hypothetical protein